MNLKMNWLQTKLGKYKKTVKKLIKENNLPVELEEQIEIEEEEMELAEVETQTSPYMFTHEGGQLEKYVEELEFKLEQEEKVSCHLKNKLKRWQVMLRKIHSSSGAQSFEEMDELEIEEQNMELCEVEIQVGPPSFL